VRQFRVRLKLRSSLACRKVLSPSASATSVLRHEPHRPCRPCAVCIDSNLVGSKSRYMACRTLTACAAVIAIHGLQVALRKLFIYRLFCKLVCAAVVCAFRGPSLLYRTWLRLADAIEQQHPEHSRSRPGSSPVQAFSRSALARPRRREQLFYFLD
jgi:hypothetical protein